MALPNRATLEDIQALCNYFSKKPTGATIQDAKSVLEARLLESKKLFALKYWGLLEEDGGRYQATDAGRGIARNNPSQSKAIFLNILKNIPAYNAIVERAAHRKEEMLASNEIAAHWHKYFKDEVSTNEEILGEQVNCFFQLAEGAGLGKFIVGRKTSPSRMEFNKDALNEYVENRITVPPEPEDSLEDDPDEISSEGKKANTIDIDSNSKSLGQGIFIAHGKNKTALEQLKKILDQFGVPYKVAIDEPNLGRPISTKVQETMRSCNCAILIFTADEEFKDKDGNIIWRPSENVVFELGASGYLYGQRIVIMKENGVEFASNFRDLGYISFDKNQLEAKKLSQKVICAKRRYQSIAQASCRSAR